MEHLKAYLSNRSMLIVASISFCHLSPIVGTSWVFCLRVCNQLLLSCLPRLVLLHGTCQLVLYRCILGSPRLELLKYLDRSTFLVGHMPAGETYLWYGMVSIRRLTWAHTSTWTCCPASSTSLSLWLFALLMTIWVYSGSTEARTTYRYCLEIFALGFNQWSGTN